MEKYPHAPLNDFCKIGCAPFRFFFFGNRKHERWVEIDFQNALVASDEIIIVSNPDIFYTEGMTSLITEYAKVKKFFNPELKIAGILINDVDRRTNFAKDMTSIIKDNWEKLKVFDTVIPTSVNCCFFRQRQIHTRMCMRI